MSTKARNSGGCWTCRLRRKKCDEARPVCHDCAALEIDCLYSEDKPEWMDGAEKQRLRAERLKKEVKRRATHRRERRYLQGLEVRLESLDASLTDDSDTMAAKDLINTTLASVPTTGFSSTQAGAQGSTPTSASESAVTDTSVSAPSPDESSDGFPLPGLDLEKTLSKEAETHWTMMYLDYVFPFLFPFYRPSFVDKGRGWLLVLLTKNKALYHAALSLAGYISGIVLRHIQDAAPMCQSHTLETLHTQQGLALQWLQREMKDICTRGVGNNLAEANHVLASIIQLMACEVAVAKPGNWTMHLSAATELFNQMMTHHALRDGAGPCFMLLLLRLGTRPFTWTPRNHPWGSDQSILRFFTAQLLFLDTLASTALEQPPRLQQWHQHLLLKPDEEAMKDWPASEKERTMPHIDLQEFVGVQNWVVLSIGEIAALDSWKKEMGKEGSLSVTQLATRAAAIEERLRTSLQGLQDAQINQSSRTPGDGAQHLMQYFGGSAWNRAMHGILLNTRIWAQAALTYLSVVLSGWQPSSPEIRQSVAQTVELLSSLPSPDCLRTLVWPFTVSGCLAAPDQERVFRDLVAGMGPLKVFGTIRDGFAIMEKVWERREEIDQNPDQWDLAACFNCLCRPALLI